MSHVRIETMEPSRTYRVTYWQGVNATTYEGVFLRRDTSDVGDFLVFESHDAKGVPGIAVATIAAAIESG